MSNRIFEIIIGKPERCSRYEAWLGERKLGRYRCPFFGAARTLQAEGAPDDAILIMRHEGSSVVAMRGSIGKAACLSVVEGERFGPKLIRFKPFYRGPSETQPTLLSKGQEIASSTSGGLSEPSFENTMAQQIG